MLWIRQYSRTTPGALTAIVVAYALFVQAAVSSIGLGMLAGAPNELGTITCLSSVSIAAAQQTPGDGQHKSPSQLPSCPFCVAAVFGAGHVAASSDASTTVEPVRTTDFTVRYFVYDAVSSISRFRRGIGEPRAPPGAIG